MPTAEAFSIRPRCRRDRLWLTARAEGRPPSTLCSCTPISRPSFWASSTIVACSSWRRKRRCSYRRQPACSTRLRSTTMYVRRPVHVDIHSTSAGRTPVFCCYNIHSVAYKLDDSLEVRHVLSINALFLVETWYDGDLFSFLRFRLDGSRSSIARDHGPAPPLWLQNMAAWLRWQSLEFVCVRSTSVSKQPRSSCFAPVFSGSSDCDVTVVYCTGSIL